MDGWGDFSGNPRFRNLGFILQVQRVNTCQKNFIRSRETKAFSQSIIQSQPNPLDIHPCDAGDVHLLGKVLPDLSIRVLICVSFPGGARMGEVHHRLERFTE